MACCIALPSFFISLLFLLHGAKCEDPYRFFTWKLTYGDIYPLGVKQQGILINGQFPGPDIDAVTNDNLVISVFNYLREPLLISWNGLQHRRNSWQDGVFGTNCPIPPGKNFTYNLQVKDQIGTYFYFPTLGMQKAAGAFGSIRIWSRPKIPVPFPSPAGDFHILAGDWFKTDYRRLRRLLENGHNLPFPDGLLINGRGWNGYTFTVDQGLGSMLQGSFNQPNTYTDLRELEAFMTKTDTVQRVSNKNPLKLFLVQCSLESKERG